jgi:transposase
LVVLNPENRQAEETDLLNRLVEQHPDLSELIELADEFLQVLRQRQVEAFDDCIKAF